MFSRILVAVQTVGQSRAALDLVKKLATEGVTKVQVLHLREREVGGYTWYSRESRNEASFVAESALFELRMGFLEVTQAIARQAAAKQGAPGVPPVPGGPSIVR